MTRTNYSTKSKTHRRKRTAPVNGTNNRKRPGPVCLADDPHVIHQAEELTGKLGARNKDLAEYFQVDITTVEGWIKTRPAFGDAVRRGRTHASLKVAQSLYQKATGCEITEQVLFNKTVKTYHPNGKLASQYTEPVVVELKKELPPDAYAANKFLSIIMREVWADSSKVDINHKYSGEVTTRKIEELSLDELSEPIKNLLFDLNMKQLSDGQNN